MPLPFFVLLATAPTQSTPKPLLATQAHILGASSALFPAGAVCYYRAAIAFAPTRSQAEEAEKALLVTSLATVDPHAKNWYGKQPDPAYTTIPAHLRFYDQQFYGFYNAKHQPCLFINAFPLEKSFLSGQRWLRETVWGYDGGTCFWQAEYNLTTHRLAYFSYNSMG